MHLTYRENYWESEELKLAFVDFLDGMFGLNLSLWDSMGFWDRSYRPFSFYNNNTLVANVCVYSLNMCVNGERCRMAQFSAVGTIPEFRKRGLGLKLTQIALDWAREKHDYFFLFADEDAFSFYRSCGFRSVDQHKVRLSVSGENPISGAVKLDMKCKDQVELAHRFALEREPVSDLLGVLSEKLFMFWCLYGLRDHLYHIPDLNCVVACRRDGPRLIVLDIVGPEIPAFDDLYPYVRDRRDSAVDFMFMVDKLKLRTYDYVRMEGHGTHLFGSFPLEGIPFMFPQTSHA